MSVLIDANINNPCGPRLEISPSEIILASIPATMALNIEIPPAVLENIARAVGAGSQPTSSASTLNHQDGECDLDLESGHENDGTDLNGATIEKNGQSWYKTICRLLANANGTMSKAALLFLKKT